jgi:DNA-binding response OmpR family regulator
MPDADRAVETILIVDDEESVRKTFREWLEAAHLDCLILTAADAEQALVEANRRPIDLAILDWNLGAGNDGLQLLEDLYEFNADVVAIMVTGFAHQATPLDAMRMGVRDYLEKNQDLTRETFLAAVRKQLEQIRPAKRERRLHQSLVAFREAVDKVLPLVQSAAALNDPVPLPEAVRSLLRFLLRTTGARDGVLLVHDYNPDRQPAETCRAFDAGGAALTAELVPFRRSLAGGVVSLGKAAAMNRLADEGAEAVELQPFERGRRSLLAVPMPVAPNVQVVLELFDKPGEGFTAEDQRLATAAAELGAEMLRQALGERQVQQLLLDAIAAAASASDSVAATLRGTARSRQEEPPPADVLERLREGLSASPAAAAGAEESLRLAEAVRVLALRHGPEAVEHCTRLVATVGQLLDRITRAGEGPA